MLEQLHIKNVALIKESELSFGTGLNILTGETGAGKSMVMDSLQFALGGKVQKDFLRQGEKQASVEALFTAESASLRQKLEENGIVPEEDNLLLIRRTLQENGKTVCRVNGSVVTIGMLRQIAEELIDFHGQHEHQSLLHPAKHIRLLDRFCPQTFSAVLQRYQKSYYAIKELDKQLQALLGDEAERERRMDLLYFQKEELETASLRPGEEEALLEERKRLSSMEKLIHLTGESIALLYDGKQQMPSACDQMGEALQKLREAAEYDASLQGYADTLAEAYAAAEDTVRGLKREAAQMETDPDTLEELEERLQLIYKLKRKYGGSVEAVLAFYEKILQEIDFLSNSEERAAQLRLQKETEQRQLAEAAETLSALRKETAEKTASLVEAALREMEMRYAKFQIRIDEKSEWTADGKDKVEFLISANAGEPLKPLAKIASGGEMSRVMLALKTVLVDADTIGTFLFDEIDTGISGRTAQKVGEKMHLLGKKRQILCITHLPQIAALADTHFLIEKKIVGEETMTEVRPLTGESSVQEVARLIGGNTLTEVTLAAARELKMQTGTP